jgi:hypothetical protein
MADCINDSFQIFFLCLNKNFIYLYINYFQVSFKLSLNLLGSSQLQYSLEHHPMKLDP